MAIRPTLNLLAAAVIGLASAASANAQLVTEWSADVTTEWVTAGPGAPTFTAGNGTQTVSPSLITWGGPGDHTIANQDPSIARSALEIQDGNVVGAQVFTNDPVFTNTAEFFHYNRTIDASRAALDTASVLTTLTLTPVDPPDPTLAPPFSTTFLVNFIETFNAEPCFEGSVSVCDDVFVVTLGDLLTPFTYNGVNYVVEIGDDLQQLSDAACEAAGVAAGCLGLVTEEGVITDAQFGFRIFAQVPEPGILALLGLGLAAAGVASRRRSTH
jgi:hypothetical protein